MFPICGQRLLVSKSWLMRECIIFAISTPGSRRHRLLEGHLSELGVDAQVVPAIFLNSDPERASGYDLRMRMKTLGYGLTKGEVGCFLAHRSAWEKVAAGDRPCLVLEDDARLDSRLVRNLGELSGAIAGTKVILRLFSQRHPRAKLWRRLTCGLEIVRPMSAGHSAVAYLLDPAAAAALLQSSTRFWQTVDNHIDSEPDHACVVMHVLPELVSHDDEGNSLIGERHKPRLSLLFRLRREWLRALRNSRLAWHREKTLWSLGLRWTRSR